jgi:hypothetical protein
LNAPAFFVVDARPGDVVVLHLTKCDLVFDAADIARLVQLDREAWIRAVRRGKAFRRAERAAAREVCP